MKINKPNIYTPTCFECECQQEGLKTFIKEAKKLQVSDKEISRFIKQYTNSNNNEDNYLSIREYNSMLKDANKRESIFRQKYTYDCNEEGGANVVPRGGGFQQTKDNLRNYLPPMQLKYYHKECPTPKAKNILENTNDMVEWMNGTWIAGEPKGLDDSLGPLLDKAVIGFAKWVFDGEKVEEK